jgi:hypothetical protein
MAIFNMSDSSINEYLVGVNTSLNEARASARNSDRRSLKNAKAGLERKVVIRNTGKEYTGKTQGEAYHNKLEDELSKRKLKGIAPSIRGTIDGKRNIGISKEYTIVDSDGKEEKKKYTDRQYAVNVDKHLHDIGRAHAMSIAKAKREGRDSDVKFLTARAKSGGFGKNEKLKEAAEYILSVLDEMDTIEDLEKQKK